MKLISLTPAVRKKSLCNDQTGYALPLVLMIMTLVFALSTALLSAMTISLREGKSYLTFQRAVLSAKNAAEICKSELSSDADYPGTSGWQVQDDGSTYTIKVQKISDSKRFVSIKTILGEYGRYYEGEAELDPTSGRIVKWSLKLKRLNGTDD